MNFKKIYFQWLEATVKVMDSQLIKGALILGLGSLFFYWLAAQNCSFFDYDFCLAGIKLTVIIGTVESLTGLKNFDRDMKKDPAKRLGLKETKQIGIYTTNKN